MMSFTGFRNKLRTRVCFSSVGDAHVIEFF
jgi:hypothetical protein